MHQEIEKWIDDQSIFFPGSSCEELAAEYCAAVRRGIGKFQFDPRIPRESLGYIAQVQAESLVPAVAFDCIEQLKRYIPELTPGFLKTTRP